MGLEGPSGSTQLFPDFYGAFLLESYRPPLMLVRPTFGGGLRSSETHHGSAYNRSSGCHCWGVLPSARSRSKEAALNLELPVPVSFLSFSKRPDRWGRGGHTTQQTVTRRSPSAVDGSSEASEGEAQPEAGATQDRGRSLPVPVPAATESRERAAPAWPGESELPWV
jgi:hypothetical protein